MRIRARVDHGAKRGSEALRWSPLRYPYRSWGQRRRGDRRGLSPAGGPVSQKGN